MAVVTAYGIDISSYQTISDAGAVAHNKIGFAFVKASEGTDWVDPAFTSHTTALAGAGVVCGGYHFARPGDPTVQAHHFRQAAGGVLGAGHLFPALDMEDNAPQDSGFITTFFDALGASGLVVYANRSWWQNVLRPQDWGGRNIVGWIADPNGDPGNPGWLSDRIGVHQHSFSGNVPGIPGAVDRDAIFNGHTVASMTLTAAPGVATVQHTTPTTQEVDMQLSDNYDAKHWNDSPNTVGHVIENIRQNAEGDRAIDTENQRRITALSSQLTGALAAVSNLADAVGKQSGTDPAVLKQAVADAIKENVVQVDVSVAGQQQTPAAPGGGA